ncbi:MAG TPA: hypothetical protein VHV81_04700 [Steroidobacteraceae bacterium]|jgi:hypothetical protein|nr:hypothetical protein [Steroidobacteraceae bacterium]
MYSFGQRLRSLRHGFWYRVSERLGWSRGTYRETPARVLELGGAEGERVAALRERYGVRFETRLSAATSRNNYEYLDILDGGWGALGLPRRRERASGGTLVDVGSASFWYAAALRAFFAPQRMVGVEVEGHRLFRDGRTRIDYGRGYAADIPGAQFLVADYGGIDAPADVITAWFPFLTPAAILAWRLPLSLLAPERLFARIRHNLRSDGVFVMVNHGPAEADLASTLCEATGLRGLGRHEGGGPLSRHRSSLPILSAWVG